MSTTCSVWPETRGFGNKSKRTSKQPRSSNGSAENPRFVVTSLPASKYPAQQLYEQLYCARGDIENRIKEQQLGLFADRTSAHTMRANQLRLWLSSLAYVLINLLRRLGLAGTELARAQASTIRTRLLKIGAVVTVSCRRVKVALSEVYPMKTLLVKALENLRKGACG